MHVFWGKRGLFLGKRGLLVCAHHSSRGYAVACAIEAHCSCASTASLIIMHLVRETQLAINLPASVLTDSKWVRSRAFRAGCGNTTMASRLDSMPYHGAFGEAAAGPFMFLLSTHAINPRITLAFNTHNLGFDNI